MFTISNGGEGRKIGKRCRGRGRTTAPRRRRRPPLPGYKTLPPLAFSSPPTLLVQSLKAPLPSRTLIFLSRSPTMAEDVPLPAPAMSREELQDEAELRMRDIGKHFGALPQNKDELLELLEDAETWLLRLDQKKTGSMLDTLRPTKAALISRDLLDYPDPDVKLVVTSCLTEITRITAPEAPYDDDVMKEVFQRIVETFVNLGDINSPSYSRRISILESVAMVRCCNLLLDLELDRLILDMFNHLFKAASVNHSENVIWGMETILKVVIEESDDVHAELASYLLQNLTKEAKGTLPASFGLAERIVGLCKDRLKPVFVQLVKGTPMDNYNDVVTFLCQGASNVVADNNRDASGTNMAGENKISEISVSGESPKETLKSEQEANLTGEDGTRPSITLTTASGNGSALGDNNKSPDSLPSSQQKQLSSDDNQAKTEQLICGYKEMSDSEPVATESEKQSDFITTKSQEPNPSTESDMIEQATVVMASEKLSLEADVGDNKQQTETGKKAADGTSKPADTSPAAVKKRGRPPAAKSLEKKPVRNKRGSDLMSGKVRPVSYSGGRGTRRQTRHGLKSSSTKVAEGGFVKKQHTTSLETQKEDTVSDKDTDEDISLKEVVSATKTNNTKCLQEDNGVSKRKRPQESEETPLSKKNTIFDENLVGSRIKVWWPVDKKFYNGFVESFNASSIKHKIAYDDGDVETLQLKKERWEFIDEEQDSDPGVLSDTPHGRGGKGCSSLQMKGEKTGTRQSGYDGGNPPKKRGRPKGVRDSK